MTADISHDMRADGKTDAASDPAADRMEAMCIQPRPDCLPQNATSLCDPYCQSGCACDQRCIVTAAGALTCTRPLPGNLTVGVTCDVASGGAPAQTDACAAGSVCLAEGCGMHCFRYCRADADCPGSSCSRPAAPAITQSSAR